MSDVGKRIIEEAAEKYGPIPESFTFGDGIDWDSPLTETMLYVELPFWLMMPPGPVQVEWAGTPFTVYVCPQWSEIYVGEIHDSRDSVFHQGPFRPDYQPPEDVLAQLRETKTPWMERGCKTVLRVESRAHTDAFREPGENEPPRAHGEHRRYWASLCEAHLPVINELVQRYRLTTYDYFAYELSPWDVPVWYLKHAEAGYHAVLVPYKDWDSKPVTIEDADNPGDPPVVKPFEWATATGLEATSSKSATPGEFDLLDARSLMERGDYTGAVRRTVTAIEAVVRWALLGELEKRHDPALAAEKVAKTDNDFPGRLRQWRKLAKPQINQAEFDEFERSREIRHEIVHRGLRLDHDDRGRAQRVVDTGRWLYNKIEAKPDRGRLRDYGVLKSVGRISMVPHFPWRVDPGGITLYSIAEQVAKRTE